MQPKLLSNIHLNKKTNRIANKQIKKLEKWSRL